MADTAEYHELHERMLMSGHCAHPSSDGDSHARCSGGQRANPRSIFQPCPCPCHLGEEYECGNCGRPVHEAALWPDDEDGDVRYTHVEPQTGRAIGEVCP